MRANAIPLLAVFETKARLEVPLFQRQYVWTREQQWEPLWEDVSRKFEDYLAGRKDGPVHFLGAMVLDQKQTPTGHVEKRQVIDGQQRLTTLQIFLAALRDFCNANDCRDLADECANYLFNKGMMTSPEDRFKVWPTQQDRAQFEDVIACGSRAEIEKRHPLVRRAYTRKYYARPRMVEAYCFFYDSLAEFFSDTATERANPIDVPLAVRLEECFGALKNALQVVIIDLDREDDAQVIFETLNARGEPLLPADLLRNYIFLRAARQNLNQEHLYHEYWERFDDDFWREPVVQGRLVRPRSDLFMQHFLASQTASDIPIKHLFVEYKFWIEKKRPFETVSDELSTLAQYGDAFRRIIVPTAGDPVFELASVLATYDISTAYPLMLQFFASNATDEAWAEVSSILESYIVRRAVCGYTTKAYNRIFLSAIRLLYGESDPVSAFRKYLAGLRGESAEWPDDHTFRTAWRTRGIYSELPAPRVLHILRRLSNALVNLRSEDITINSQLTVEHIMPQNWIEHWPLEGGVQGLQRHETWDADPSDPLRLASERRWSLIDTIGNLTAITQHLNSEISNGPWTEKKPRLLEVSLLPINQRLHAVDSWNEESIERRADELFEIATRIWPSPDSDAKFQPSDEEVA